MLRQLALILKLRSSKDRCIHNQQSLNGVRFLIQIKLINFWFQWYAKEGASQPDPPMQIIEAPSLPALHWEDLAKGKQMPRELQDASMALFFLRSFYFCNVTFKKPVSLSDVLLIHLPWSSLGFHGTYWGNSSSLTAAGDRGCHRAHMQSSLHHSSLEAKPHHQLNSHTTEGWKENITEQNTEKVPERAETKELR